MKPEVLPFALAGVVVIAATVLAALGAEIPEALWAIGLTSVGAGGGAAIPRRAPTDPTSPTSTGPTSEGTTP